MENEVTENGIKNDIKVYIIRKWSNGKWIKNELKQNIGMSVHIATVDTTQKWNEIKLLNRKIEIRN